MSRREESGNGRPALPAVIGSALAPVLFLVACQTPPPQKLPKATEWQRVEREASEVSFVGEHQPDIISTRMRWLNGRVREEEVFLVSDAYGHNASRVNVNLATIAFNKAATDLIHDPEYLENLARNNRCGSAEIDRTAKTTNLHGPILYVVCRYENGDRCVTARQGIRNVDPARDATHYFAIADWFYCSASLDEKGILDMFASLRVKGDGK